MASLPTTMKVELTLSPEDRVRFDTLIDALKGAGLSPSEAAPSDPIPDEVSPFPAPETEPEKPAEAPAADPAPTYTVDQIRSKVVSLSRKDAATKDKVRTALNKYAESVSKLAESDYAAFMADMEALG